MIVSKHFGFNSKLYAESVERPSDEYAAELLSLLMVDSSHDKEFIKAYMRTAMWVGSRINLDRSIGDGDDNIANALVALCSMPADIRANPTRYNTVEYPLTNLVVYHVRKYCLNQAANSHLVVIPLTTLRRHGLTRPKGVKSVENGNYVNCTDSHRCRLDRSYVTGHTAVLAEWPRISVEAMLEQLPAPESVPEHLCADILATATTNAQSKIMRLLAEGYSHREIANQLECSTRWVDKQVVLLRNNNLLQDKLS